jgi:predicted O-methyltransferase YrrM
MNFAEAARIVSALPRPHTFPKRGRLLYKHIRENKPENVLELGTAGGGSAVFIAAALEANGSGHLTSVDSLRWTWEDPTPLEVLEKAGLSDLVILDRRFSTYTWFLKTEIEKHLDDAGWVRPAYDLIFLDGSKSWSTDGLAVVLAESSSGQGGGCCSTISAGCLRISSGSGTGSCTTTRTYRSSLMRRECSRTCAPSSTC